MPGLTQDDSFAGQQHPSSVRFRSVLLSLGANNAVRLITDNSDGERSPALLAIENIVLRILLVHDVRTRSTVLIEISIFLMMEIHGFPVMAMDFVPQEVQDCRADITFLSNLIIALGTSDIISSTAQETMAIILLAVVDSEICAELFDF